MGRFKAGDRVKILAGHPYWIGNDNAGVETEGVYVTKDDRGWRGKHIVKVEEVGGGAMTELAFKGRELEPLVAAEWVPKVGDRVRYDDGMTSGEGKIVAPSPEAYFDWSVRTDGDQRYFYKDERFDFCTRRFATKHLSPIQAAKQPAGLTIEVGKFYRTRDGWKVGPMVAQGGVWPFYAYSDAYRGRCNFEASGKAPYLPDYDLVAEWVDGPAVEPEATTDEVAVPKFTGKGAPGDVVRCDVWNGTLFKVGREYKFDANGNVTDEHGFAHDAIYAGSWTFLRNEPAAPPAKFKVGDRVKSSGNSMYEYRVAAVHAETLDVRVIERDGSLGSVFYGTSIDKFSIVDPAPTPTTTTDSFIVARLTANGAPRPNARPRVHATLEQANQEAQRLADRLGDEFAVYQRVSSKTVDAGPVPPLTDNLLDVLVDASRLVGAFSWDDTKQRHSFWHSQYLTGHITPLGRAILRKWIAEVEAKQPVAA